VTSVSLELPNLSGRLLLDLPHVARRLVDLPARRSRDSPWMELGTFRTHYPQQFHIREQFLKMFQKEGRKSPPAYWEIILLPKNYKYHTYSRI